MTTAKQPARVKSKKVKETTGDRIFNVTLIIVLVIIDLIMLQLARDGRIAISPGSNATRWQTKAKVKQKLAAMEGGE